MNRYLFLLVLFAGSAAPAVVARANGSKSSSASVESEVMRLAGSVRRGILAGRSDAILELVSKQGMACFDSLIAKEVIEADLHDRKSLLHAILFDSDVLRTQYSDFGLSESWRDMFKRNSDVLVSVRFESPADQEPYALPCVSFTPGEEPSPYELCFFRRGGRWWLRDSLLRCK